MMPQDGMGPNNGQHMYQNCQNQMMPQDGMGRNNGQHMYQKWANASARSNRATRLTWPNASRGATKW